MVRNEHNSERRSKWNIYNIFRNRYISTISTRNNRKNSRNHRDHRYRQNHNHQRYYNVALCLLAIVGTPALAEEGTQNTSNPVAAATSNNTNQSVQFNNNGAPSRQHYAPSMSCNGSTLTVSPFYMGNDSEPVDPEAYVINQNWGLQLNFMIPLDRESLRQCKRIAKRVEEKYRLDYELVRALKCAELQQKGFMIHPKSKLYVLCHDVVPISQIYPKKPKKFGLF